MDFRKECKRFKKDTRCRTPTERERVILATATAIEVLIVKKLFGLRLLHTMGLGASVAVHGMHTNAVSSSRSILTEL
jgi:hypothetical protein